MSVLESEISSAWISIIVILILIIAILGLSCWYSARRRQDIQHSSKKKQKKAIIDTKPIQSIVLPKTDYLPSPGPSLPTKSRSTSSSQLTSTDIAYLNKLVRTASDRSLWKRDYSNEDPSKKPRKVPSGHIHQKT